MYRNSFLKWAGNKYRILDTILDNLPTGKRLIDPFAGSGAVFLNADYQGFLVSDVNADLINLFKLLKKFGPEYISFCSSYFTPENNTQEAFYSLREKFNASQDIEERSAIFVYLNRHAYNGLMRYNSKGQYNVPFGRYKKPYFPSKEMIVFYTTCKSMEITFSVQDFRKAFECAVPGDVIYCDPPYIPLSSTANFTAYAGCGFTEKDHLDLAMAAEQAMLSGIPVIISNHNTEFTRALYNKAVMYNFFVQRSISCNGEKRKKAHELLAVFHDIN